MDGALRTKNTGSLPSQNRRTTSPLTPSNTRNEERTKRMSLQGKLTEELVKAVSNTDSLLLIRTLNLNGERLQMTLRRISGLSKLSYLQELDLSNNEIEKIEGLNGLKNLQKLSLQNNRVKKIENLSSLKQLELLNLAQNQIQDIPTILAKNQLLKTLDLSHNLLSRKECLSGLRLCGKLRSLFLIGNAVSELEGHREYIMQTLAQLSYLDNSPLSLDRAKTQQISASLSNINCEVVTSSQEVQFSRRNHSNEYEGGKKPINMRKESMYACARSTVAESDAISHSLRKSEQGTGSQKRKRETPGHDESVSGFALSELGGTPSSENLLSENLDLYLNLTQSPQRAIMAFSPGSRGFKQHRHSPSTNKFSKQTTSRMQGSKEITWLAESQEFFELKQVNISPTQRLERQYENESGQKDAEGISVKVQWDEEDKKVRVMIQTTESEVNKCNEELLTKLKELKVSTRDYLNIVENLGESLSAALPPEVSEQKDNSKPARDLVQKLKNYITIENKEEQSVYLNGEPQEPCGFELQLEAIMKNSKTIVKNGQLKEICAMQIANFESALELNALSGPSTGKQSSKAYHTELLEVFVKAREADVRKYKGLARIRILANKREKLRALLARQKLNAEFIMKQLCKSSLPSGAKSRRSKCTSSNKTSPVEGRLSTNSKGVAAPVKSFEIDLPMQIEKISQKPRLKSLLADPQEAISISNALQNQSLKKKNKHNHLSNPASEEKKISDYLTEKSAVCPRCEQYKVILHDFENSLVELTRQNSNLQNQLNLAEAAEASRSAQEKEQLTKTIETLFSLRGRDNDLLVELKMRLDQLVEANAHKIKQAGNELYDSSWLIRAQGLTIESLIKQKQEVESQFKEALNLQAIAEKFINPEAQPLSVVNTSTQCDMKYTGMVNCLSPKDSNKTAQSVQRVMAESSPNMACRKLHTQGGSTQRRSDLSNQAPESNLNPSDTNLDQYKVSPISQKHLHQESFKPYTTSSTSRGRKPRIDIISPTSKELAAAPKTPNTQKGAITSPKSKELLTNIFKKLTNSQGRLTPTQQLVSSSPHKPSCFQECLPLGDITNRDPDHANIATPASKKGKKLASGTGSENSRPDEIHDETHEEQLLSTTQSPSFPNKTIANALNNLTIDDTQTRRLLEHVPFNKRYQSLPKYNDSIEQSNEEEEDGYAQLYDPDLLMDSKKLTVPNPEGGKRRRTHSPNVFSFAGTQNDLLLKFPDAAERAQTQSTTQATPTVVSRTNAALPISRSYRALQKMLFDRSADQTERSKDPENTSRTRDNQTPKNTDRQSATSRAPSSSREPTCDSRTYGQYLSNFTENLAQQIVQKNAKKNPKTQLLNVYRNISHYKTNVKSATDSMIIKSKDRSHEYKPLNITSAICKENIPSDLITPKQTTSFAQYYTNGNISAGKTPIQQAANRQKIDLENVFRKPLTYRTTFEKGLSPSFQSFLVKKRSMFQSPEIANYSDKFDLCSPHHPLNSFDNCKNTSTSMSSNSASLL